MHTLQAQKDPQRQCRELLGLLHTSEHPQAFVQLYRAIKEEPHLDWLVDRVDKFSDESVISVMQEQYLSDPTGKCEACSLLCGLLSGTYYMMQYSIGSLSVPSVPVTEEWKAVDIWCPSSYHKSPLTHLCCYDDVKKS